MNFNDYPIGTEFLCLTGFSPFLTKGKVYKVFLDCTGTHGIYDNICKESEYESGWRNETFFVLNSPAMKILYGV